MFIPGDIYTTSGPLKLYHCWTDKVTKFDSSAFYNWEQDNMPIYDLEERTFYLWEQLGYPTSSIPGVAMVVSADAPNSVIGCNKNIFRTVSAAVEALPQTINFPIVMEVANFGELGDLVLNNYKFGPRGSLEIINRNFSRQEYTLSNSVGFLTIPQVSANYYNGTNTHNYVSSFANLGGFTTIGQIAPLRGFLDSSCLSISCAVFSSTYDARLSGTGGNPKLNGYASVWKVASNYNKSTLVIDSNNTTNPYALADGGYGLAFTPYTYSPDASDDVYNKDASTVDYLNSNTTIYGGNGNPNLLYRAFNGLYYGNKLFKVQINNCDGPIFIRNFFLDGKGNSLTNNNYGVEINNSPNVYLENMISTRYRKAGFYLNNSTVNLLRGCVATRIYNYDSAGNRLTGNYANRRAFITYNDSSAYTYQDDAAGILANNSVINVSSTRNWELAKYQSVLGSTYSALPVAYQVFEFNDNANGIILNNSKLVGGDSVRLNNTSNGDLISDVYDPSSANFVGHTIIDLNSNVNCGLISNNSKISLNGKLRFIENLKGAEINSSEFEVEQLHCFRNQTIGIEFNNSTGIYNKNLKKFHDLVTWLPTIGGYPQHFDSNGIHLSLNSSRVNPAITSSMELRYADMWFTNPIGSHTGQLTESIKVSNNSDLTLVSPRIARDVNHSINEASKKGSEINCVNNSKVTIRGTRYYPTRIIGPTTRPKQKRLAAICANQNSIVNINGPTIIGQFGIDILADKNSTINITPPKTELDGIVDSSSINLNDSANHTMVELHSTRSCIVADNESTINMKDLGSFRTRWNVTGVFDSYGPDYGIAPNSVYNATYVSGGSLQFYPNPNSTISDSATNILSRITNSFTKYPEGYGAILDLQNTQTLDYSGATFGGMCVRAVNNSIVNVHNVNFPCGWWNASSPYYDGDTTFNSGGACYRTFIWNIADTSQLKASFLSVSGLYPSLAGYVGPYGYWTSGSGNRAASGLPLGTPDTSSMSILDIFGSNPSGHAFTQQTATNYGPFRLYFGVNPFVNSLTELNGSSNQGIIRQIYSQGYQPSASLLCSGSLSGTYRMALLRNSSNNITPSGFYYGSGVMDTNGFNRIVLDESAADTFANAKHCAAGKSGNARLASIYSPYTIARYGDSRENYGVVSVNLFDIERDN